MIRKKICLVTKWYPTPDNPSAGLFFKEQAFAVAEYFDFLILHYYEIKKVFPFRKYHIEKYNAEKNTEEYNIKVFVPICFYILNVIHDLKIKYIHKKHIDGIGKYESPLKLRYVRSIFAKIVKSNPYLDFDALYCVDAQKEASILKLISDVTDKPYIVAEHAPFPWPGGTIREHCKQSIEQANLFFAISCDKIRQMLLQNIKLPEIVYMGNLVDENQFLLRADKEKKKEKTFIIVAAHSFFKNYDLFIKVMERLTEITEIPFRVMIVGYASDKGYSKEPDALLHKIRNSKFANRAELIPEVEHDKMGEVYNRADAFVMTSIQEGQPVSAMEAACCGLPIFSTMCGGVEDYVTEDIGRIFKITDSESFAYGLKDYLEGKITFCAEHIRERTIELFGREAFVKRFVDSFERVIKD